VEPTAREVERLTGEIVALLRETPEGLLGVRDVERRFSIPGNTLRHVVWAAGGELFVSDDGSRVALTDVMREWWPGHGYRATDAERAEYRELLGKHRMRLMKRGLVAPSLRRLRAWHPELAGVPAEDLLAGRDYTRWGSRFNRALRSVDVAELARWTVHIRMLVSGLNQLPVRGWVNRGVYFESAGSADRYVERYEPGRTVTESQIISASKRKGFSPTVKFRIFSVTGGYSGLVSSVPAHHEVTFRPGTTFHVLYKQQNRRGRWTVVLVEAGPEGPYAPWPGVEDDVPCANRWPPARARAVGRARARPRD
jgi:hypothetical protein